MVDPISSAYTAARPAWHRAGWQPEGRAAMDQRQTFDQAGMVLGEDRLADSACRVASLWDLFHNKDEFVHDAASDHNARLP